MNADGKTLEPLVTITEDDLREFEGEGVPQVGRIALREFKEKGISHIPREPGDNHGYVYLKDFREDPENNPLPTRSGKLEIRCQVLADHVNRLGWSKRSEEHTSELQSLMRNSYAVFCLQKQTTHLS